MGPTSMLTMEVDSAAEYHGKRRKKAVGGHSVVGGTIESAALGHSFGGYFKALVDVSRDKRLLYAVPEKNSS
jgi:hypothetical protein